MQLKSRRSGLPANPLLTPANSLFEESGDGDLRDGGYGDGSLCGVRKSGERFLDRANLVFLTVAESFFTESSYSARIALSSASSALDILSDSCGRAGVEDLLLLFIGDDDEEVETLLALLGPLPWSSTSCQPDELSVVLFITEVSGELTPESVDV